MLLSMMCHDWYGVVWCGVVWCGVVWCGAIRYIAQRKREKPIQRL